MEPAKRGLLQWVFLPDHPLRDFQNDTNNSLAGTIPTQLFQLATLTGDL